tara:strand:+ start:64 stop:315 length:252 start_codon:yes stop_codon:yes gene_type:complete
MIQDIKKYLPSAFISVIVLLFVKFSILQKTKNGLLLFAISLKNMKNSYFMVGFFLINLISILFTRIFLLRLFISGIPTPSKLN